MAQFPLFDFEINSMYDALPKFTQSLLADNVVITFPGYTKSYQPK